MSESSSFDPPLLKRFVVLRHDVGRQFERTNKTHLDWMFESGGKLRTWTTPLRRDCMHDQIDHGGTKSMIREKVPQFTESFELPCEPLADHRIAYLSKQGDIGGERGYVTRILAGTYEMLSEVSDRFVAEIRWRGAAGDQRARLDIYRSPCFEVDSLADGEKSLWRLSVTTDR